MNHSSLFKVNKVSKFPPFLVSQGVYVPEDTLKYPRGNSEYIVVSNFSGASGRFLKDYIITFMTT